MIKVSIVIAVYNVEKYLRTALESAVSQTVRDIEMIAVDDGSTDGSGKICDEYAKEDNRMTVIHKSNGGLSSARNAGVAASSGEYILFLDGDDYLDIHAVERLTSVAEDHHPDIVQFRYREVADGDIPPPEPSAEEYTARTSAELFENLYRLGGEGASACTKLIKRELLLKIPFRDTLHEDEAWCTEAFRNPLFVYYIGDMLYCYVRREGSIITGKFNRRKLDFFRVSERRSEVLSALGLTELLKKEYGKLFFYILTLYREASDAGDEISKRDIKKIFKEKKTDISKHGCIKGKFLLIYYLMRINFGFIKLYSVYYKMKNKKHEV